MTQITKEVIAGFYIGDGHQDDRGSIHFTQKDPTILYAIQEVYYGRMRIIRGGKKLKAGPCHRLTLSADSSRQFIDEVGHLIHPWKPLHRFKHRPQ